VTRRGIDVAVLVSIEEWRRLQGVPQQDLKCLFLAGPRFDMILPKRGKWRSRKPVKFD
jgi:hypothetical protein